MNLTRSVSEFASGDAVRSAPEHVRSAAKRSVLDALGLAVAGSRSEAARIARQLVAPYAGPPEAAILGGSMRAAPRFASFLNGLAIHADDYDDTQLAVAPDRVYGLLTHPTAPVLPAVLAVAERDDRSGAELLDAYLVGVEVETKVAEAIDPRHYDAGFHSTGTIGTIGAAVGAARLLGLDAERMAISVGVAASQAAGLRENFGTMTKPFHAGRAAESGVVAAELARAGFTAAPDILEARRGFFQAAGGGYDATAIDGILGAPWTFEYPGISIKPHPSGSLTHPGMGALLDLILANDLHPDDVAHVRVGTNRHMPNALIHHRPGNALQAKFSMEFCVAILLLERRAGLAEFTDEVVCRPDVVDLIGRVEFGVDPEADATGYQSMTTIIDVSLRDGRRLTTRAEFGKGSPQNPMSDDELMTKFQSCLEWGGVRMTHPRALAERVLGLEHEPSVRGLLAELTTAGTHA